LFTRGTVVVHLGYIAVFLCAVRWRHSKAPNSKRHFWSILYQFEK